MEFKNENSHFTDKDADGSGDASSRFVNTNGGVRTDCAVLLAGAERRSDADGRFALGAKSV